MKRLILVRHGKSSREYDLPDKKRPLKKRGYKDGKLVAKSFREFFTPPAKFWSSPAVRAHETAKMFREALEIADEDFEVIPRLYTFDPKELLEVIKSCPDQVEQLAVFGHNPAMTSVVNRLGSKSVDNLPTTGLCVIDFDVEHWNEISRGQTVLTLMPKNLR